MHSSAMPASKIRICPTPRSARSRDSGTSGIQGRPPSHGSIERNPPPIDLQKSDRNDIQIARFGTGKQTINENLLHDHRPWLH